MQAQRAETRTSDLHHYFEYSSRGVEVVADGLEEMTFGEYLVEIGALDRYQLFRALQLQDRSPGVRLSEAAAALGFAPIAALEKMHARYAGVATVAV